MKQIKGKVLKVIPADRTVFIIYQNRLTTLGLSRKVFKDFGPYLSHKPYIVANVKDEKTYVYDRMGYEVSTFVKIVHPTSKGYNSFYDLKKIQKDIKKLFLQVRNRLFIDLEFSMPSYYQTMRHVPEILQYGIILEDNKGNTIFKDGALVRPQKYYSLNKRTLGFLGLDKKDFIHAVSYKDFYSLLKTLIQKYDPKIYAWGKNDILTMEESFRVNGTTDLDIRSRYIDLMQVIKNYYNIKNDLGLFNTYQNMAQVDLEEQDHNAYTDAKVARYIYRTFKKQILNEK